MVEETKKRQQTMPTYGNNIEPLHKKLLTNAGRKKRNDSVVLK